MNEIFNDINELKESKKIAIAVSGGIDSLSLVFLANNWCKENNIKVIGITVDHGLRKSSNDEAVYINSLLKQHNIEHHILVWEGKKPSNNVESIAREARYKLIFDFCRENNIKTILLGHHLQDQAENFLIRLFRGSGILGLSSMQKISHIDEFTIIRPFLNIKKEDLREYLIKNNIEWVEDESNTDEKYLRNKIRNFLNSFEEKDNIVKRINVATETFQAAENIIKNKIQDLENEIYSYNKKYNYYTVNYKKFLNLEKDFQLRIISKIAKNISDNVYNPRLTKLERLLNELKNLKKYTFYNCVFEKISDGEFVCYKEYNSLKNKELYLPKGQLNQFLQNLKKNNIKKYNEIKNFRGYKREILYTIPIKELEND
ncbi:MAG TPA: tRNA lysidine(34) synthetase TilS [Rickettsiales bacterium]|nr:tRNA lysidine(34) synthetase TilS [Rickettsiales bacterium]